MHRSTVAPALRASGVGERFSIAGRQPGGSFISVAPPTELRPPAAATPRYRRGLSPPPPAFHLLPGAERPPCEARRRRRPKPCLPNGFAARRTSGHAP